MKILDIFCQSPERFHKNDRWLDTAFYVSAGLLFIFYFVTPFLFSFLGQEFKALPKNVQIFLMVVPHQALLLAGMFFIAEFGSGGAKPGEISSRLGFLPCGFADLRFAVLLILLVFPLSALLNSLVYIISSRIGIALPPPVVGQLLSSCPWPGFVIIAFGALVLAPLGEEIIFRRIIFCYASKYVSVIGAAVISSAVFAAAHFNIRHFAGLFILGLALQFLYIRNRSLYPCILLHFIQNLISITAFLFLKLI
ncbi:MAG: type II CAAX endopeptidase family protein [Eubacteriales bacterium]|nr:type II CAAX endopeptidase family protein [Eubacteriales bacterium]